MSSSVDIKQLLEAGAHFGHRTSRWHPKMAQYIHSSRGGIHIIDLAKTVTKLEEALAFIEKTASAGRQILLVGTKRQAKAMIKQAAEDTAMPYVSERWIGGMLTNSETVNARVKHLKDLEQKMDSGALDNRFSKLEVQRFQEEIDHLNHQYGGIKHLSNKPGAMVILDVISDKNALREARKLKIPVVAIVDSNANPEEVDYPVPANDDASKSLQLILEYIVNAINSGKDKVKKAAENPENSVEDKQEEAK